MTQALHDLLVKMRRNPNHISASTYDMAWLSWLYPEARHWLVERQHPDGSWGAEVPYYHDRIVTTLAAINAIAATSTQQHDLKRVERGIRYLERAIPRLKQDVFETVAFELLAPTMVKTGQKLGLKLDKVEKLMEPLMPIYYQKLALIKGMAYSPQMIAAHSLEFIGFEAFDQAAIPNLRSINGSIHNSPAATAFVEVATQGSVEGQAYLKNLMERYNGVVPGFAPLEMFELIWVLYHLSLTSDLRVLRPTVDPFVEFLNQMWTDKGVGFSATLVPDADDTSLGFLVLHKLGRVLDPSFLEIYEVGDHFQCFPLERNISLDIHIHIVDALKDATNFPRRDDMLMKALNILGRDLTTDYVVDKWHISPYYSTSHAIIALTGLADNIIKKQINWLLKTQRPNGSWTFYPTSPKAAVEETAYALMALMTVSEKRGTIPLEVIERGFRYLEKHYTSPEDLPALWIHKTLYNPYYIVESVILSAQHQYQNLTQKYGSRANRINLTGTFPNSFPLTSPNLPAAKKLPCQLKV
jgi:halimadienyl-diphosphate synthase